MRLLLDTHAFLWWVAGGELLSLKAREAIADEDNEVLFSAASAWEIAIKVGIGRLEMKGNVGKFLEEQVEANGFGVLPVELAHAARVAILPDHHRDPFDRLLVAQAQAERLTLVTGDRQMKKYAVQRLW